MQVRILLHPLMACSSTAECRTVNPKMGVRVSPCQPCFINQPGRFYVEDKVAKCIDLTDREVEDLLEVVKEQARSRIKARTMVSEIDFAVGAMTVLFAAGREEMIPSGWIFSPFSGNEPFSGRPTSQHLVQDSIAYTDQIEAYISDIRSLLGDLRSSANELRGMAQAYQD